MEGGALTLAVKSMQNLQSYVPINITALEASIDALVANSFKVSGIQQDLIEINDVLLY